MLMLQPTALAVNGPISDMDRVEQLRAALTRIAKNAGHAYGGHYAVAAATLALAEDDKFAAEQNAAQIAYAHEQARRAMDLATEAESLPW